MKKTKSDVKLNDYTYHSVYGVGKIVFISVERTTIKYKGAYNGSTQITMPTSLVEVISEEDAVMYKLIGKKVVT